MDLDESVFFSVNRSPILKKRATKEQNRSSKLTIKLIGAFNNFFFLLTQITIEPEMDTLYWCKILKAPVLQDKHHIIGYEALLTKER